MLQCNKICTTLLQDLCYFIAHENEITALSISARDGPIHIIGGIGRKPLQSDIILHCFKITMNK